VLVTDSTRLVSRWASEIKIHPAAAAMLCIVMAHLPFWLVQSRLFELRPVFSYDLLFVLLAGALLRRPPTFLVLCCWCLDGMQSVATSFHFANAADFASTMRFAGLLRLREFVSADAIALFALFVVGALLLAWGLRRVRTRAPYLFVISLVIVVLDVVNGSTRLPGLSRDTVFLSANIAGSPLWNMYNRLLAGWRAGGEPPRPWWPLPASYSAVRDWLAVHPDGSVFVVLVESMGNPRSSGGRDLLLAPLRAALPDESWAVDLGSEPFRGGTTSGELRVLCGLDGRYQSVRDTAVDARPCLPERFLARGSQPVGLHGFSGQMFDRVKWWSRIGLQRGLFAEQLANDANRCGEAFQGVCDRALVQEAVRHIGVSGTFVYALTLNTHLPLRDQPIDPRFNRACAESQIRHLPCLLLFKQAQLLADLAQALRASGKRPLVVIAGDHAPPFGDAADRANFETGSVPVVILRPKS
jgi:hypothetical protein